MTSMEEIKSGTATLQEDLDDPFGCWALVLSYVADQARGARCTGHCCRRFSVDLDALTDPKRNVVDGNYLRDMLVLLDEPPRDAARYLMACRHFDGRDCTAYSSRPRMCRDYPYGRPCKYDDCTFRPSATASATP